MSKYKKFYFLHIPKTGGRFFTKYIVNPIEKTLKENGIEVIQLPHNVSKHGGWHKDIDENTYIISIFRDPAEFFVSAVAHMVADQNGLIDEDSDFIVKDMSSIPDIEKIFLFDRLQELKYLKNFQSQNLLLSPQDTSIINESRRNYNKGISFNHNLAYNRAKKINLMIRHKDLRSMDYSNLINKISNDLGIDIKIDLSLLDREHYKNSASEILFNKLTKEDIDLIYKDFMLDKEIYNDDSLFWTER
jgi:hypothetical protein